MKRTVEHIYNLGPTEVIEAFRFYLTFRELRMPDDDKECEVSMNGADGVTIKFTEEVQDTSSQPGQLVFASTSRLARSTDGL